MRDAVAPYLAALDLDVELRDAIAEEPADTGRSPVRLALAAASIAREPMRALSVVGDLRKAAALAAAGADEGRQWLEHQLADAQDHYSRAVWHLVAGQTATRVADDLAWLEERLARRAELTAMAVRRDVALPRFRPEPDPAPGWREADGAPPLADPFVPKAWTYAAWYGRSDVDAPAELDDPRFGAPRAAG